jgi:hypothetical protein
MWPLDFQVFKQMLASVIAQPLCMDDCSQCQVCVSAGLLFLINGWSSPSVKKSIARAHYVGKMLVL